ncbi:hypothetical protein RJ641_032617 [Dillenia turbinata]|uniref:Uncharacterized protein n=1 Tax=Dillenia turbinata TaxID=194707 RepID=A0AAN8VWK7_9MAGN
METSLRYGGDSESIRFHAKEKFPLDSGTRLQLHGELDTADGATSYASALVRHFYPDLSASLAVGLQFDKREKVHYCVRGKKAFLLTPKLSVNIKGRCYVDKDFKETKCNFQEDQDVRVKVGFEVFDKVPYLQIRENNWTLNADLNGKWNRVQKH